MIYVVVKEMEGEVHRPLHLVKAATHEKALAIVGADPLTATWACFTTNDLRVIVETREGYITQTLGRM